MGCLLGYGAHLSRYSPAGIPTLFGATLGMDFAGRQPEQAIVEWWRTQIKTEPLGITRTLSAVLAVATWPVVPRPQPPAGNSKVKPLVIGNLHDPATPYSNAQEMLTAFPNGRLMTTQFYGHLLRSPKNATDVWARYEKEIV